MLVTAAVGTGVVALAQLALRAGVGTLGEPMLQPAFSDAAFALSTAAALAAAALVTIRRGAASGLVTGVLVAAGGAAVLAALVAASGNGLDASGVYAVLGCWVVLALVLGIPVNALACLVRRPAAGVAPAADGARRRRAALAAAGLLALVLGGDAFAWGGPWVVAEGERLGDTWTRYLQEDLPYLLGSWQHARTDAEFAMAMADPSAYLGASTLPAVDQALGSAELVTDRVAAAAAVAGEGTWEDVEAFGAEAERAVERFGAAHDAAVAASPDPP